jgi:hypothetical protein
MRNFIVLFALSVAMNLHCLGQDTGFLSGTLRDQYTGEPLFAVRVSVDTQVTRTGADGAFQLELPPGTYDIHLDLYGLYDMDIAGVVVEAGDTTVIDIAMEIFPVPAAYVKAQIMDDNTWVEVTWMTSGPEIYEDAFDDGEVDDFLVFYHAGGQVANKFTPYGDLNRHIVGGRIFVGDSTFPGPFLDSDFLLRMYDDQGMSGKPGNIIDEDTVTVEQYGWMGFDRLDGWCGTGNYYLGMCQLLNAPEGAPFGIDLDNPTYPERSFSKIGDNSWEELFQGNAMIRSWVAQAHDSLDVAGYRVGRFSNFDPYHGDPLQGTLTELANTQDQYYEDFAWAGLGNGCVAYGVRIMYDDGSYSPWNASNVVCSWPDKNLTMDVSLTGGSLTLPIKIKFMALDQFHEDHTEFMAQPSSETYSIPKGRYRCELWTPGYQSYSIDTVEIMNDTTISVQLQEMCSPVNSLDIFPFTGEMEWERPYAYLYEWECDSICHSLVTFRFHLFRTLPSLSPDRL